MLVALKDASFENSKVGFVVSSKVGNAVIRHKVTRRLRNIFAPILPKIDIPTLFQYVAFKDCANFQELEVEIKKQLMELGIL